MKTFEKYPQKLLLRAGMLLLALCIATVPVNSERCGGNVLKISILGIHPLCSYPVIVANVCKCIGNPY